MDVIRIFYPTLVVSPASAGCCVEEGEKGPSIGFLVIHIETLYILTHDSRRCVNVIDAPGEWSMAGFNDIKMAKINGGSFSYIVLEENKHVFHVDYSREYLAGSSGRTNTFKALPTKSPDITCRTPCCLSKDTSRNPRITSGWRSKIYTQQPKPKNAK